jgi:TPP-dependent indolepyruvate ferredoxin oxidoreductase alpha subunit
MAAIDQYETGSTHFLLGNEAIARGALESDVNFVTGYPGTPSSEIVPTLAQVAEKGRLHVEWSTNELAAVEGAGAAATAGLRSLSAMKNAGLSVALDFLTHFAYTGLGNRDGAMVTVVCDDPYGHSSGDETDSRWLARFASTPMLEPLTGQQALNLVKYAFDLSERHGQFIFYRGYTRLCHSSSPVTMGRIRRKKYQASSDTSVSLNPFKLLHSMGSGTGTAAGLGQLEPFEYRQPVIAVCGDSSFFHSSVPRLINAVYNKSKMLQIVLDNSATAMTGFQPHPGTGKNVLGDEAPRMDIVEICRSLGCQVKVADPFEIRATTRTIRDLLKKEGVQVLILRQSCEIVRMKAEKTRPFDMEIDESACKGEECAICSSSFRCPATSRN